MDPPDLDPLFAPDSVAVVGASPDSWYSSQLVDNLLEYGYDGDLYLVNPGRDEAWERPCYDAIDDVPEVVDLAAVSVPREYVVDVVRAAGERGVPAALVITAGFAEADEEGERLQADLAAVADEHGVCVCGPNSIGLASALDGTVLTSTCSREPEPGRIGLVSQSGALAFTTFYERAADEDVHFAYVVSTGNEADLTLTDYAAYMADDPRVDAVCAYIEGLEDPGAFVTAAEEAVRGGTPVLAVKVGRSAASEATALSHTGSLTGSDAAWNAAFAQSGTERVADIPDLLGRASAHAAFDPPASNRVCVASTSGGLASLLADMAGARDLDLPDLGAETERALLGMDELLTFGDLHNPIDVRGYGADVLPAIAETLFADDRFDAYVFAIGLSAVDERAADIAADLRAVVERADAPVFVLWTGRREPEGGSDDPLPYERLRRETPVFYDPERCMDALASLVRFREARERLADEPRRADLLAACGEREFDLPAEVLSWDGAASLLAAYDVETVPTRLATDPDAAAAAATDLGFPVVLKVDSPDVPHRTEAGAVRTGLDTPAAVREAYAAILENVRGHTPDATTTGVLVQPHVEGVEALVGVSREPGFGPLVTVATGGRFVELLDDGTTRVPPVSEAEAGRAIEETRLGRLLAGYRGAAGGDPEALASLVANVGRLAVEVDAVAELDLNPVMVGEDGAAVADALVRGRNR